MSAVWLTVPVDRQLEAMGRSWCRPGAPYDRAQGAKILRHFKNPTNAEILKSLLQDPSKAEASRHQSVPGKRELELVYRKDVYYVRQAAFDALREWGAKVERPVLEELLEGHADDTHLRPDDPAAAMVWPPEPFPLMEGVAGVGVLLVTAILVVAYGCGFGRSRPSADRGERP